MNNKKDTQKLIDKLRDSFSEMARIKSDFDILKFTMDKSGPFIAHQWHFVARQYQLTLGELKRFYLDKEQSERTIELYKEKLKIGETYYIDHEGKIRFYDIEIERLINEIDGYNYQIIDKKARCERYEYIRQELEKENDGMITDEQFQSEEPAYWEWNLTNQARQELITRNTGVSKGVIEALDMCTSENKLLPEYKVNLGKIDGMYGIEEILSKSQNPETEYSFKLLNNKLGQN